MKRITIVLIFTIVSTFSFSQKKSKNNFFTPLQNHVVEKGYEWRYEEGAKIFERIYLKHSNKKKFKKQLFSFLNNDSDKMYWIGIFLKDNNAYYTSLTDYNLALEVLNKGLELEENNEMEQIRFLFILGKHFYFNGEKEKSLVYLIPGYNLSNKFPGNVPTFDHAEQAENIYNFIELNIKN